jgi:hypothetical protein
LAVARTRHLAPTKYRYAIAYTAWGALSFNTASGFDSGPYASLEWTVNPHGQPIGNCSVLFTDLADTVLNEVVLSQANVAATLANGWVRVSVPVSQLNPARVTISSVQLKNATSTRLPTIQIDDVRFVK